MDIHGLLVDEGWSRSGFRWKPLKTHEHSLQGSGIPRQRNKPVNQSTWSSGCFRLLHLAPHRPEKTSIFYAVNMGGKNRQKTWHFWGILDDQPVDLAGSSSFYIIFRHTKTSFTILHPFIPEKHQVSVLKMQTIFIQALHDAAPMISGGLHQRLYFLHLHQRRVMGLEIHTKSINNPQQTPLCNGKTLSHSRLMGV